MSPIDVFAAPSLDCEGLWQVCMHEQWLVTMTEVMIVDRTLIWNLAQCGQCHMCHMGCTDPENPKQILLPSKVIRSKTKLTLLSNHMSCTITKPPFDKFLVFHFVRDLSYF
jgi:hypothetical protein